MSLAISIQISFCHATHSIDNNYSTNSKNLSINIDNIQNIKDIYFSYLLLNILV